MRQLHMKRPAMAPEGPKSSGSCLPKVEGGMLAVRQSIPSNGKEGNPAILGLSLAIGE
jgi:hypothetical protein